MFTPSIACIVYVTVLLLCASTSSMPAHSQSRRTKSKTYNSQELPPQLPEEHEAEGTTEMINYRYKLGYD
jgi:hypothetical protein